MDQRFDLLRQQTLSDQSIKILCLGQQEVGKSSFLSSHVQNKSQKHLKDTSCEIFLKHYTNSLDKKVWVQFYQLSNTYPEYLGCYMVEQYGAIILFYDMTDKKSRNRLNLWLRLLFQHKKQDVWDLPILVVGLKKNLLDQQQRQQIIKDVKYQFHNIFSEKSFLFFGEERDEEEINNKQFEVFIKRIINRKYKDSFQWQTYKLVQSIKIYNYMYTYFQMVRISGQVAMEKVKSTIQSMNLKGLVQKASQMYVRFTDKLANY